MGWGICGVRIRKMNRVNEKSFKRAYGVFGGILIISTLIVAFATIYFIEDNTARNIVLIFSSVVFIANIGFVLVLRNLIGRLIGDINEIIDDAISGKFTNDYDENIVSMLAHKIVRFIGISESSKSDINKERNEVKSFISDISHQTKTPLSNIIMYTELLSENIQNPQERKIVKNIEGQADKLQWLIDSLVKMSRLETAMIGCNREENYVQQTILNVINQVFSQAEQKGIEIEVDCSASIKGVYDGKWTTEALVNIVENAIKYTHEEGKISINVEKYDIFIKIEVIDNGIGIDKNEINNIFKRFYRASNARNYEGIGVGLYLAREIIAKQKGYIKVNSEEEKGSRFSVFLLKSE